MSNQLRSSPKSTAARRTRIIEHPIGPTLFKLTIPMLFALVAIMGLGVIDSFFIGKLGTEELAAIGFILPISFIVTSVALGLGMAISSLNSKLIGAEKMDQAARLITDGFFVTAFFTIVLGILLVWQLDNIFELNGADSTIMPYIKQYMHVWLIGMLPMMLTQVCSSTFRSLGDTGTSATIAITMTLTNLVLDPLLIFGIGPFPELKMQGAAWATVIAVAISCFIGVYKLGVKEKLLLPSLPDADTFRQNFSELLTIAVPAVLANVIVPFTGAVMIGIAAQFGADATAGFGVGARIEALSLMIVYALSSTLPMFIGQNLGANKPERVLQALKLTFKFVFILQFAIYLLLAVFAAPIAALFSDAEPVRETIIWFLRIIPVCHGMSGIIILINVSMNVLGHPRIALYINVLRLALFYFPLALLGAKLYAVKGMFIGIAVGHICAFILASVLLLKVLKETKITRM